MDPGLNPNKSPWPQQSPRNREHGGCLDEICRQKIHGCGVEEDEHGEAKWTPRMRTSCHGSLMDTPVPRRSDELSIQFGVVTAIVQ